MDPTDRLDDGGTVPLLKEIGIAIEVLGEMVKAEVVMPGFPKPLRCETENGT